ncbi:MAG: hypothetical protein ACI4I2_11390 [Oscillospiraceae bacterium]
MKKLTAAVLLSALLLTACGDNKADGEISEAAQTATASIEITETTVSVGEGGIIIHDSDAEKTDARKLTSAENIEITLLEENTESAAETTATETAASTALETTAAEETVSDKKTSEVTAAAADESSIEYTPDTSADICLGQLSFGMKRSEAEAAVKAELDEETRNPFYSIYYNISVDIDEKFDGAMFSYGESGLDQVALYAYPLTEDECAALRDRIIEFFSAAYGFSADDWEIEENSDYCEKDSVSVFTRVYLSDGSYSVSLLIGSWDHRSFKNQEQRPILP